MTAKVVDITNQQRSNTRTLKMRMDKEGDADARLQLLLRIKIIAPSILFQNSRFTVKRIEDCEVLPISAKCV
jgi:hypothetical protein